MILFLHAESLRLELRTRMPFRYGVAVATEMPHLFLRIRFVIDGEESVGVTADHLPPKWFTKQPERDPAEEIAEMETVIARAVGNAREVRAKTVFHFVRELTRRQAEWGREAGLPPLLTNFGVAMVEKALLDAYCRRHQTTFREALRGDGLGIEPGMVHPELTGTKPSHWLPEEPVRHIQIRHTVGLADVLREADLSADDRLDDGLPQTLEACIRRYGLSHFKIKVANQAEKEIPRLRQLFGVLREFCPDGFRFSLDGNESSREAGEFRAFWEAFRKDSQLSRHLDALLFVEQPFHRDLALDPGLGEALSSWTDRPPLVIDESDAESSSLPQALAIGYNGTSHKNCKGVTKGIVNACLLAARKIRLNDREYLLSGEDLSNIVPFALLQDLVVQSCLGISSVERNGHHYFRGTSHLSPQDDKLLCESHPDLLTSTERGWSTLRIEAGRIQVDSLLTAPFGCGPDLKIGDKWCPMG